MVWSPPKPPVPMEREFSEGRLVSWDSELVGWVMGGLCGASGGGEAVLVFGAMSQRA